MNERAAVDFAVEQFGCRAQTLPRTSHPSSLASVTMEVDEPSITYLPLQPLPTVHVPASYDEHRDKQTPLCIDNGSTHLRFGFCTADTPRTGINMIAKYKERKTNKPLLLFGEGIDVEGGARSQAKTPWEGDVLLNFDALVCFLSSHSAASAEVGACSKGKCSRLRVHTPGHRRPHCGPPHPHD